MEHQKGRSSEVFEIVSLVSQKAVVLFTDFFFSRRKSRLGAEINSSVLDVLDVGV